MGQRLVVTIKADNKEQMKIYYHWSAYTISTFGELDKLWNNCIKPLKRAGKNTNEILLGIIHFLEGDVDEEHKKWLQKLSPEQAIERSCHGGIGYFNKDAKWDDETKKPNKELEYIQNLYPNEKFDEHPDRNNGLIFMSPDGMADVQGWSEGNAEIDIDAETFCNDVYWQHPDKESYVLSRAWGYEGKDAETEKKDAEDDYDNAQYYDKGDGIELFEGKCDEIVAKANTLVDLVKNEYHFRDKSGGLWELIG